MNEHTKQATEFAFSDNVAEMKNEIESSLHYKLVNALEAEKIEIAKNLVTAGVSEEKECCDHEGKPKGNQNKLDVAEPKGKLTAADFKKLRKEDVEQLDELSKEKLGWYLKKASKHMDKKGENMIKRDKKFNPGMNPLTRIVGGAVRRQDSIATASHKYLNKEDVEQVDEKLTSDMPASKIIHDFVHSDNPKFKGKSKKDKIKMALGAFYGMNPSKSKNEEVEQIQELSKDTLSSYKAKAEKSAAKSYELAGNAAKRSKSKADTKQFMKHVEKFGKRQSGINSASKKLGDE